MTVTPYTGTIPNRSTQTQAEFSTNVDEFLNWFAVNAIPEINAVAVGSNDSGAWNALTLNSNGTAAAPVFRFASEPTTGLYRISATNIGLSISGSLRYTFGNTTFAYAGTTMTIGGGQVYRAGVPLGVIGAIIEDQKTSGTNGGDFTSGTERVRDLNTLTYNALGIPAISANQFTLTAGTYHISWDAPCHAVSNNQSMLYNATDAVVAARGSSGRATQPSPDATFVSSGSAVVTIAATKAFEIRHRCVTTQTSNGFGVAVAFGTEVYTRVRITKIA